MPFAKKFRAMTDVPFPGDMVGPFIVKEVNVRDERGGSGRYAYSARMVLRGPGGQQGVRRALKALFSSHPVTFSGYGNPYQLWFGKPEIESLGEQRYTVSAQGSGARVYLEDELHRFLGYLEEEGKLATPPGPLDREALVETYLEGYRAEIRRKVARYQGKLRRVQDAGP